MGSLYKLPQTLQVRLLQFSSTILSCILGFIDNLYGYFALVFMSRRWFPEGVGNMENFMTLQQHVFCSKDLLQLTPTIAADCEHNDDIDKTLESNVHNEDDKANTAIDSSVINQQIGEKSNQKAKLEQNKSSHFYIEHRIFESPLRQYLPPKSQSGHIRIVYPGNVQPENKSIRNTSNLKGILVHLTMTGDQDYAYRTKMLAKPLAKQGYLSILLIVPCYGSRRPDDQDAYFFKTVEDLAVVGVGCIVEGAALCQWASKQWPGVPIGVTGISWGASMCSGAALLYDGPVAVCPCLGDTSPRALTTGILRHQVQFGPNQKSAEEIRKALDSVNMWALAEERKKRSSQYILSVVSVSAKHDSIVPPEHSKELHRCLSSVASKSEHKWLPGGHASCIGMGSTYFVDPIIRSMENLVECQKDIDQKQESVQVC